MIGAQAAGPDAPKGQVGVGSMEHGVVHGGATGNGLGDGLLCPGAVLVEAIQRQGARTRLNEGNGLIQGAIAHHRQHRAKDFLLHHRHGIAHASEHRGGDETCTFWDDLILGIDGYHLRAFLPGILDEPLDAFEVAFIDDPGEVRVVHQCWVAPADGPGIGRDETLLLTTGHHDIIRGDAGLSRIDGLAQHDALHRLVHGIAFGDDHRRFAAHLQGDGREIAGRSHHHLPANVGVAGIEQVIERQLGKGNGFLHATCDHGHQGGIERLGDELGDYLAGAWRGIRWLEHGVVASSQRPDQR